MPCVSAEDSRPNVIVIVSDDQGGGDYGFLGNEVICTPEVGGDSCCGGCAKGISQA